MQRRAEPLQLRHYFSEEMRPRQIAKQLRPDKSTVSSDASKGRRIRLSKVQTRPFHHSSTHRGPSLVEQPGEERFVLVRVEAIAKKPHRPRAEPDPVRQHAARQQLLQFIYARITHRGKGSLADNKSIYDNDAKAMARRLMRAAIAQFCPRKWAGEQNCATGTV
jgi:hypothetical protein